MRVTGSALLAGCGQLHTGAATGSAGATTSSRRAPANTPTLAVAANSGCVQATPVVQSALGVLTAAAARGGCACPGAARSPPHWPDLERWPAPRPIDVLQESLANAYDAFTAFQAVMQDQNAPAYPGTFSNLLGTLSGFRRTCSVVDTGFANGTGGGAASANTSAHPLGYRA